MNLAGASEEAHVLLPYRSAGDPEEEEGAGVAAKDPADLPGSAVASAQGRALRREGLTVHGEQGTGRDAVGLAWGRGRGIWGERHSSGSNPGECPCVPPTVAAVAVGDAAAWLASAAGT